MAKTLRLTAFEESLLLDDRPGYPWSCFIRLRFAGCLQRGAFETAARTTLSPHPLIASLVRENRRRLTWHPVENPRPQIDWIEGPLSDEYPAASHLDVRKEIGVRFTLVVDPESDASDLVVQFHHSCCDGKGGFQFVGDLIIAYAGAASEEKSPCQPAPLNEDQLKHRNRFGLSFWRIVKMIPTQLTGLIGAWEFLGRTAAPLLPHEPKPDATAPPSGYPATETHCFDEAETTAILNAARLSGNTLNNLLIRDLILAIDRWRANSNVGSDEDWLRLMVPMNMRSAADEGVSAANIMSTVFIDRRREDCVDSAQLLQSIREQMDLIKRRELGFTYLFSLVVARALPGGLARFHWDDRCVATAILSNVGRPFADSPLPRRDGKLVAGNVVLERAEALAPLRPNTCVSLTLTTCSGRLAVAMHYDPRALSTKQSSELLRYYVDSIQASAGCFDDANPADTSMKQRTS